jgi:hypothetical protein
MKKLILLFIPVLFLCNCTRNEKNIEQKHEILISDEANHQTIHSEEQLFYTMENIKVPENLIGTYLTVNYLDELNKTRSHIHSIMKTILDDKISLVEIIISEDNILFIFNLHEGIKTPIIDVKDNILYFETRGIHTSFASKGDVIIKDNEYIIFDNVIYKKVTNDTTPGPSGKNGVKAYITNIILGNYVYYNDNGDELFRLENGNIFYKNEEFEIGYYVLFANKNYDHLEVVKNRSWPPEDYWMEIIGDEIFLFVFDFEKTLDIHGTLDDWHEFGEFAMAEILKRL